MKSTNQANIELQEKIEHGISPTKRQERNKKYNQYVEAKSPKTKNFPTLFNSFWVGGLICCLGQGISDLLSLFFPFMTDAQLNAWMLIILIFLACLLTSLGVFDIIGNFAGAGTIVPITGFANSICSPALEYKKEGIIFGVCSKMFIVAGPVIVCGTVASVIVGIVYLFI
ncbi:MAG: SpoVA/SpoVAEb family sporulation membrane protein [Clostridiales bacterium]|nr:SpoVA/SpoVAEb family sporulation membrane protein [Candidatus Apopatousia equi]